MAGGAAARSLQLGLVKLALPGACALYGGGEAALPRAIACSSARARNALAVSLQPTVLAGLVGSCVRQPPSPPRRLPH